MSIMVSKQTFLRWESRTISSSRMSSRNHSPNSVLSKDPFVFFCWTLSSDVLTQDCCCRRREGNGFPMHAWRSSSFKRCSNLVSLTRDIPRQAVKIRNTDYRSVLSFRATMNRNSWFTTCQNSYETFRIIQFWYLLEDDFEFILATFRWWHACGLIWKFVYSSFNWAW